jgi:hypothetical protein
MAKASGTGQTFGTGCHNAITARLQGRVGLLCRPGIGRDLRLPWVPAFAGMTSHPPVVPSVLSTLMSAFPSSGRVNLWLPWKRLVQALPSKAGGTAVMTTVDHTLMRGSKPHDR